jgi:hypothetical protein
LVEIHLELALQYKEQQLFGEANVHFKATKELLDQVGYDKLSLEAQINFHLQTGLNARAIGDPFGSMKSLKKALLLLGHNAYDSVSLGMSQLLISLAQGPLFLCTLLDWSFRGKRKRSCPTFIKLLNDVTGSREV